MKLEIDQLDIGIGKPAFFKLFILAILFFCTIAFAVYQTQETKRTYAENGLVQKHVERNITVWTLPGESPTQTKP